MTVQIDAIAPPEIGEDRFSLSVNSLCLPLLALNQAIIDIDYSAAGSVGFELPIEFIVQPPSNDGSGYVRRVYRKHAPPSIAFMPITAGRHLILVKECCHNRWQGRLVIDVGGDEADKIEPLDRI
jgi:hypothetical protein